MAWIRITASVGSESTEVESWAKYLERYELIDELINGTGRR